MSWSFHQKGNERALVRSCYAIKNMIKKWTSNKQTNKLQSFLWGKHWEHENCIQRKKTRG